MPTKTNWKELYNDLPVHIAEALRTARLKPEQVIAKEDGELMAIEGIKEEDVNTIRAIYNTDSVTLPSIEDAPKEGVKEEVKRDKAPKAKKRSQKYRLMVKQINKETLYSVKDAIDILSSLSKATKIKTVELHLNTRETGMRGELRLPHSTGKNVKVAIFSNELGEEINKGIISFDILLCTPKDMPQIAKYAKVLGPKGLMPNPKNGTVTENPDKRSQELTEGGTLPYKTEAKFPIIHLNFGAISQDKQALTENITEAIKSINPTKIKSAYLSCTHTPSVKLSIGSI